MNKIPLFKSFNNRVLPILVRLPVRAGSTQAIAQGAICKLTGLDFAASPIAPAAEDDSGFFPLIAWQEQAAGDPARCITFAVPCPGDLFEFPLNAATAMGWGDGIAIKTGQSVKKATAGLIGAAWGNYLDSGTAQTVTSVYVEFHRTPVAGLNKLPILGLPGVARAVAATFIADPTGGTTADAESRAAIAAILNALEASGIVAAQT